MHVRMHASQDNEWEQLCYGTCSRAECAAKCVEKGPSSCSHFAFDPLNLECITFASCSGETFHDNFDLYRYDHTHSPAVSWALVLEGAAIAVGSAAVIAGLCRFARSYWRPRTFASFGDELSVESMATTRTADHGDAASAVAAAAPPKEHDDWAAS